MNRNLIKTDSKKSLAVSKKPTTDPVTDVLIKEFEKCVPPLGIQNAKGAAGRVAIIGGSNLYSGPPYFAAMGALRSGADLVFIFTSSACENALKSYSPEYTVCPILEDKNFVNTFYERSSSFTSIIIGPGLGRPGEVLSQEQFNELIDSLKQKRIPLILDGDAFHFVAKFPKVLLGYREAILTPNFREFKRLYSAVAEREFPPDSATVEDSDLRSLASTFGNLTILCKNSDDKISDGSRVVTYNRVIGPKRFVGEGDIMSGVLATFIYWVKSAPFLVGSPSIIAAVAASIVGRRSSRLAFNKFHRSTGGKHMIEEIAHALKETIPGSCEFPE